MCIAAMANYGVVGGLGRVGVAQWIGALGRAVGRSTGQWSGRGSQTQSRSR